MLLYLQKPKETIMKQHDMLIKQGLMKNLVNAIVTILPKEGDRGKKKEEGGKEKMEDFDNSTQSCY